MNVFIFIHVAHLRGYLAMMNYAFVLTEMAQNNKPNMKDNIPPELFGFLMTFQTKMKVK